MSQGQGWPELRVTQGKGKEREEKCVSETEEKKC